MVFILIEMIAKAYICQTSSIVHLRPVHFHIHFASMELERGGKDKPGRVCHILALSYGSPIILQVEGK